MTTFIDLIRHGETTNSGRFAGSTDHPLTQLGLKQMWDTVEKKPLRWQRIITSPLKRCVNFAQELGRRDSIPVTQDERIKEIHFGQWENRSAAELMLTNADDLARFWQNPLCFPPPMAEHLHDFEARILSAWHDILQQFPDDRTLLVTHSGVIRVILCHIQQHPLERLLEHEINHADMVHVSIDTPGNQATLITDPMA